MQPLLGNLPLFPDHEALRKINNTILEHQTVLLSGNNQEVVDALSSVLRGLNHESIDVRLFALSRLRHTLRHNQGTVHHLTTDSDNVHPVISELFSNLLGQCREVDEELQTSVAECLGLLGAIDPTRLYTQTNIKEEMSKIHLSIESELFILELVTELGLAFWLLLMETARRVLPTQCRIYGVRDKKPKVLHMKVQEFWDVYPISLQEIIFSSFDIKYTVSSTITKLSSLPSPYLAVAMLKLSISGLPIGHVFGRLTEE
ncbi:serine/threonine-protein kinase atr-like [Macrobrachium nipponense]|uniref:serine/threonine-protein kinase atr-like n=1 Tax=Macrobrachium nipponense TaxID=159736 RepID=UPI0030C8CC4B